MASSIKKALWASSTFQSRTNDDRKAYRAMMKNEDRDYWITPEGREALANIDAANRTALAIEKFWRGSRLLSQVS